jgi:hypothetical protein
VIRINFGNRGKPKYTDDGRHRTHGTWRDVIMVDAASPTTTRMNQTILALCALAVAGLLAHSVLRSSIDTEVHGLRSEVEIVAVGILQETFEWAGRLAFDERAPVDEPSDLTPAWLFGGADGWDAATALEHLHGASREVSRAVGQDSLRFTVSSEVQYVRRAAGTWETSESQEMTKQLTLRLTGPLETQAVVRRIYSHEGF